jgi:nucleotide-binding universal stress UspA family protein
MSAAQSIEPGTAPRINFRNILLATDFSPASETALVYATAIARRYDAKMYVAHVIKSDAYQLVPAEAMSATQQQTWRYAEQQMTDLLISGRLRGIQHQVLLKQGEVWEVLEQVVQAHDVNLVVLGTRGRTGLRKLILGSTAEEVFRLSPVPMLTVGPKVVKDTELRLGNILYATNFRPNSLAAAPYAFSLARENGARLTMLHVVTEAAPALAEEMQRVTDHYLDCLQEIVPGDFPQDPELVVKFGAPAETILKVAEEKNADLIVIGVRPVEDEKEQLPPPKAYRLVCSSRCPVLTVRGKIRKQQ